jgi:glucose-6-phosphate isomerase
MVETIIGESEGKEGKGIFPSSVIFSTDLHSMGQYIQEGRRDLFETVINIKNPRLDLELNKEESDLDGLNYLAGKTMNFVNQKAFEATSLAHKDGGVPNIVIEIEDMSPKTMGYLLYFFEKSCMMSGYILGVNPLDQPGVEAYKKNMFALLGKPGFEDLKKELEGNK